MSRNRELTPNAARRKPRPPNLNLSALVAKGPKKVLTPAHKKEEWHNFKDWKLVHHNCVQIFHGKKPNNDDFERMFEIIRNISSTEVGSSYLLSKNYEETILKRGMIILREEIKEKPGHVLLIKVADIWARFYSGILPTLQALFYAIPTKGLSVRQITLVSFRDVFLLKTRLEEALIATDEPVPKGVRQMLLVLQGVRDASVSENYMKLEALCARVVNPFLGCKGLCARISETKEHYHEKLAERSSPFARSAGGATDSHDTSGKSPHGRPPSVPLAGFMPASAVGPAFESDADLDELANYRRQKYNRPEKLSCVIETGNTISESLASLIADGFEIG